MPSPNLSAPELRSEAAEAERKAQRHLNESAGFYGLGLDLLAEAHARWAERLLEEASELGTQAAWLESRWPTPAQAA